MSYQYIQHSHICITNVKSSRARLIISLLHSKLATAHTLPEWK